jgi:putative ABC transport system permease protein
MVEIQRSRVQTTALLNEAIAGITQRPGRAVLTALGTVIGIAVLIAILGLTSSASVQVSKAFSLVEATEVRVTQEVTSIGSRIDALAFPLNAGDRAKAITGVRNAGLRWHLQQSVSNPPSTRTIELPFAASAGFLETAGATYSQGRGFDTGHEERTARVAVMGIGAANDLGISDISRSPAVIIGGAWFTVIGIIDDTQRLPELLSAVVVPMTTAHVLWHDPMPEMQVDLVVDVEPGAGPIVGQQLPLAMSATHPNRFSVTLPPDPTSLRETVDAQLSGLFLVLAVVCLVVGMVGIANTTVVAVMERTGEIGLRRAMGALPRHIAAQFLVEASVLGALGGLTGTSIGVVTVVIACSVLGWTAVISPLLVILGPLVGLAAGAVAGIYPSLRAASLEPVDALRS